MSRANKNKEGEDLFRIVVEAIRSSLDIKIVKQKLVDIVGKALSADRCFILEYDKTNDNFLKVSEEYLSTSAIPSYVGIDLNENIPMFALEFKKGKSLLFNQTKALLNGLEIDLNDDYFEAEKNAIEYYKVYSALVFPIYYLDDFLGDLILHYVKDSYEAGEDEINLLKDIANQIATALYQANLYKLVKKNSEKETALRKLIEAIRVTINLDKTKEIIVKTIGETLNADRCFITDYDLTINKFLPIKHEYLSSKEITSVMGLDVHEIVPGFLEAIKSGKYLLAKNKEIFLDIEKQDFTTEQETFEKYGVNSTFAVPLFYQNIFLGVLSVHYVDENYEIGEFEINLMKDIANQVAIAVHQANLYETVQEKAKKEFLLRSIIEASRKSLNFKTSSKDICKAITELFNVERVSIGKSSGDRVSNVFIFTEYTTREDIKTSKSNINFSSVTEYWKSYLLENFKTKPIDNVEESDLPQIIKKTYQEIGIKSIICLPLGSEEHAWGGLFLAKYDSAIEWTKEQIELLETVASQVYVAMRQSELYEKQKELTEREKLLLEITNKIRSSLDIEKTLDFVCEETAKLFDVQRVTIVHFYDQENFENYSIRREYKTNKNLKGLDSSEYSPKAAAYWNKFILETSEILAFDNIQESDTPEYFRNCYTTMDVKSMIGVSIKSETEQWGTLVLSEYNKYRHWSNEEKNLLIAIASQVYIAINQAELYKKQKLVAERERISKNIIEILRNSIDKTIIKKLFVKNIGKFFDADRVFFSEYDSDEKKFIPIDKGSEYLSSLNEKSFIGIDWSQHCIREYYQAVQEKREIKIFAMDEYIRDKELEGDIKRLLEEAKIKSSYSFPVYYQDKPIGAFCIDFTQRNTRLSDEDINRIRNMCTQAGIALYHATLYEEAQKCFRSKKIFISEYSEKIKNPVDEILDTSMRLSQNELERTVQIEYLNKIINACNQLLELTKTFSEN